MKILLLIDVQEGYVNEETKQVPANIEKHMKHFSYDLVIATRFINKNDSLHKSELNMQDMTMLSPHAKLVESMNHLADIVLMKSTYTSLTEDVSKLLAKNNVKEVYLAGFNTDTSIMATALDLFDKGMKPIILANLCGAVSGSANHQVAIEMLQRAIGENNVI